MLRLSARLLSLARGTSYVHVRSQPNFVLDVIRKAATAVQQKKAA